jgi:hypothetical protein
MPLDHNNAFITISFAGLALSCINQDKNNRFEVGILSCDQHELNFDIQEITLDPESGQPISAKLLTAYLLDLEDDILIEVVNPAPLGVFNRQGVLKYQEPDFKVKPFNRLKDGGDHEDFRWIVDLEGSEFYDKALELDIVSNEPDKRLQPLIFISDGVVYTEVKTDEKLARVSLGMAASSDHSIPQMKIDEKQAPAPLVGNRDPSPLGKVACRTGLDIICREEPGSGVKIGNKHKPNPLFLPYQSQDGKRIKYQITIENLCEPSASAAGSNEGTDFRFYNQVLKGSRTMKYDLQRVVQNGNHGDVRAVIKNHPDLSMDYPPQDCLFAFLSRTNTLANQPQAA